jgi:hypothetical protein
LRVRVLSLAAASAAVLLLAVAAASTFSSREARAGDACPTDFVIDFAWLPAGTILGDQYADVGVQISAVANGAHPDALIVFDSDAPPTHDPDLAVGIGNIAILAKNLTDESPADGLVDDPDENDFGGRAIFEFDQPVSIGSFLFVDKDHATTDFAITYDALNNVIKQVAIPMAGDGSVQTITVDAQGVRRLELVYRDSAGFTGIEFSCEEQTPSPTPPPVTATPTVITTASPTPSASPTASPTPTAVLATATPPASPSPSPSPSPGPTIVAAATQTPVPEGAVLQGIGGLPGAGGALSGPEVFGWTAAVLVALGTAASYLWLRWLKR